MGLKRRVVDYGLAAAVALAAIPMREVRKRKLNNIPKTYAVLKKAGVFPLKDHYYEPLFDFSALGPSTTPRPLPGINFALEQQTALLQKFTSSQTLIDIPATAQDGLSFYMNNNGFEAGDAEIWFHVIKHFKPARIVEVGSGNSTRMACLAIAELTTENPDYSCDHLCIEPYEMPWLEGIGVRVIREKLEDADLSMIDGLAANDILFIDSSHIIRPGGEVLMEFLQVLPRLAPGVIVHVHDIFSPRDYPAVWRNDPRFWNEQYLLEAFLTHNNSWEVLLAVNMLRHERYAELKVACPHLHEGREPGSFYMRRIQ